jgi:hypothetical protein
MSVPRLVAFLLLVAALALPACSADEPEARYQQEFAWFLAEETALVAELRAWQSIAMSPGAKPREAAARLDERIAARWEQAHQRLSLTRLPPESSLHEHRALVLAYTAGRRDAFRLMAEAIRANDREMEDRAMYLLRGSNSTLQELNALRATKK